MTDEQVEVGQYLAVPFNPWIGNAQKNETILDGCANLVNFFPIPRSFADRRVQVAAWLMDPNSLFWEVWYHGQIVGILGVTQIVRGLDAAAHFAFFDRQLLGRRQLVLTMMGWCFRNLELRRLTVEIPDYLGPLIRFARAKLGFRYEGETRFAAATDQNKHGIEAAPHWVAWWGSRKERAHWNGTEWSDVRRLRLLREEFLTED